MEARTELLSNDPETGGTVRAKPSATTIMFRVFMQAATLTFLAEWGDRSQLATIILSAREVRNFILFCSFHFFFIHVITFEFDSNLNRTFMA